MPLHTVSSLNNVSIPLLLDWWQQRKRVASARSNLHRTLPKCDEAYLQAYYRLMEVYSVVKSGGVKAQMEAVQAFGKRESSLLYERLAKIDATPTLVPSEKHQAKEKVQQELSELHSANNWRLQALTNITAEEETLVKQYLCDIEQTLMQAKYAQV